MGKNNILLHLLCVFVCVAVNTSCAQQHYKSKELAMVTDNRSCQIIEHIGYTVCYNTQWHIPNWVAYELTSQETMGQVPRKGNDFFQPDPQASDVTSYSDYSASGYDRGHMAPAGDMKWSKQSMMESFYLSNICPQNHSLNDGIWKQLEEKSRSWAQQYGSIYIVCGPLVSENYTTIGENKIVVPDSFFKVILKKNGKGYDAIGFVFKNEAGQSNLASHAVTVDSVEDLSNINFFYSLPDKTENEVEAQYSLQSWGFR